MCIAVLRRYQANVGVTLWGILLLVLSSSCGTGSVHTHEGVRRLHSTQELVDLVSGESHRPMYTLLFFGWPDWDETTREWLHVLSEAQTYPLLRAMKQVAAFEMVVYFLETPQSLAMADLLGILEFPSVSLLHHRLERRAQSSISNQVSNEPVRTLALSHPLQYASTTPVTPSELAIWIVANVPTRVIHPSHLHMERLVQEVEEGPEDRVWAVRQESESDASVGLLVMVVFLSSSSSLLDSVPLRVAQNTVAASLRSRYWVRFQRCARLKRGALSDPEVLITAETGDSNVFIFQKEATGSYRVLHAFRQTDWLDLHSLESKIRLQLENAAEVISWDTIEKRDTFDRRRRIVHYAERPFTEIRTGEMYDRTIRTGSNFVTLALCFETEPDDMAACQAGYANFILCALTARSQLPLRFFWVDTNRHPRFSRAIVSQHRKEHPSDRIFVLSILPVQHQGGGIRHAARLLSARSWDTLDGAKYATNMFSNHRLSLFDHPSPSTFEKSEEDTEAMDENDEEVISASTRVTLTPDFPDEEEESVLKVGQDDLSPPAPRRMGAQGKPGKPSSSGNRAKKTAAAKGSAQSTLRNKQAKLDEMKREIEEKKRRKDQRVKEKQERLDEERHVARNTNRRKLEKQAARKKQKEAEKAQRQRRAAQSNKAKRDEEKTNPQRGDKKSERKRSGKQAEEEL